MLSAKKAAELSDKKKAVEDKKKADIAAVQKKYKKSG